MWVLVLFIFFIHSCCVDEVAGQRLYIDSIIHYGRACLSQLSDNLPVLYVFVSPLQLSGSNFTVGSPDAIQVLSHMTSNEVSLPVVITYDFRYRELAATLYRQLIAEKKQSGRAIIWSEPDPPGALATFLPSSPVDIPTSKEPVFSRCGRRFYSLSGCEDPASPWGLVYVGEKGGDASRASLLSLYRILLSFPEVDYSKVVVLHPGKSCLEPADTLIRSLLRRRTYLIERAKDAVRVGILIGTLSVARYRDLIDRLQTLLRRAGRQPITLAVGRLTPSKLGNLPELDLLVLVACPESSLLDLRDELLVPIVTPFELECALASLTGSTSDGERPSVGDAGRRWTGQRLWTDFSDLLPGGSAYVPEALVIPDDYSLSERLDVSLITGRMRRTQVVPPSTRDSEDGQQQLAERGAWTLAATGFAGTDRTWYGLDPQYGETPVAQLRAGRSGVPTGYTDAQLPGNGQSGRTTETLEW